jgi:RNA polymerase-binding protein DksA
MVAAYDELKIELEQQRSQLLDDLAEDRSHAESGMGYGTHQADDASLAYDQAADLSLRRNTERLLYQIERALTRMEEGTYGICRQCGKPIDLARLRAIPHTRYCMTCASHEEALSG